jgi:hypothetical protein
MDYYITRGLLQKLKTSGHLLLQSNAPGTNLFLCCLDYLVRKLQNWKPQALLMKTEKNAIDNRSIGKKSNKTSINRQLMNKKT